MVGASIGARDDVGDQNRSSEKRRLQVKPIEAMSMPLPLRRMTISDAMILVGVTATALATARVCLVQVMPRSHPAAAVRMTVIFVALALTITLIPLRFRRPRSRRPGRHPGTVACCAVAMALAFILAEQASTWLKPVPAPARAEPLYRTINLVFNVSRLDLYSPAVAGAWLALALSGRWRPGRDWLDWAGLTIGVCWIVAPFIASWVP